MPIASASNDARVRERAKLTCLVLEMKKILMRKKAFRVYKLNQSSWREIIIFQQNPSLSLFMNQTHTYDKLEEEI